VPSDSKDDDAPPAPGPAARSPRAQRRPLYRVVEFVRDDQGRIQEHGRIWHSDLRRVRQFGRAVANNTGGSRVVIADNPGRVVEELTLPDLAHPEQGQWDGWRDRALPPLPRRVERARLKREAATTPAAAWVAPSKAEAATTSTPAVPAPPAPHPTHVPTLGNDTSPAVEPSDVEVVLP
jgi:hypothetical protein